MGAPESSLHADIARLRNDVLAFDQASTNFVIERLGVDMSMPGGGGRAEWMKVAEQRYGATYANVLGDWVNRFIKEVRDPADRLMDDLAKLVRTRPPALRAKVIDLQSRRAARRAAKGGA